MYRKLTGQKVSITLIREGRDTKIIGEVVRWSETDQAFELYGGVSGELTYIVPLGAIAFIRPLGEETA